MILKKMPLVGKRKINQAFLRGRESEKSLARGKEEEEEKADVDKGVESNREIQMRKK